MIKNEKTTINGKEYIVTLFPAVQAYLLARRLGAVFLIDSDDYSKRIDKLCEIDPTGELIVELLSSTLVDNNVVNRQSFDNIYRGNLSEALIAVLFVIKVNFPDFLGEGRMESITEKVAELFPEEKKKDEKKEEKA